MTMMRMQMWALPCLQATGPIPPAVRTRIWSGPCHPKELLKILWRGTLNAEHGEWKKSLLERYIHHKNTNTNSHVYATLLHIYCKVVLSLNPFLFPLYNQEAPEVLARETWMTELPPELQHIGLGARTFKKRSGPENKDRSIWTDTPADRERKDRVTNYNLLIYMRISALLPYFLLLFFLKF